MRMYRHFSNQFEREVTMLHPGDFLATGEDIVISTVLGSCIAVALYDPDRRIGGLNHFMLPGVLDGRGQAFTSTSGKYGMYAMELLINEMIKQGCRKERLKAKIFGGGSVLARSGPDGYESKVPQSNIDFAEAYLEAEKIPVLARDTGGTKARKLFFFPESARILLKKLSGTYLTTVEEKERDYLRKIRKKSEEGGSLTLF